MALKFIGENNVPSYIALSTDIASSTIPGIGLVGKLVFTTDDSAWYIIESDLTLSTYAIPAAFAGSITLGTVDISQATQGTTNGVAAGVSAAGSDGIGNFLSVLTAPGAVNSAPLSVIPLVFNGSTFDRLRGSAAGGMSVSDMGFGRTTSLGISGEAVTSGDISTPAAITDAPTAGQKIVITDVIISSESALTVTLTEETSGKVVSKHYMAAGSTINFSPRGKIKLATADKKLFAGASGAGNITFTTLYYSEA